MYEEYGEYALAEEFDDSPNPVRLDEADEGTNKVRFFSSKPWIPDTRGGVETQLYFYYYCFPNIGTHFIMIFYRIFGRKPEYNSWICIQYGEWEMRVGGRSVGWLLQALLRFDNAILEF